MFVLRRTVSPCGGFLSGEILIDEKLARSGSHRQNLAGLSSLGAKGHPHLPNSQTQGRPAWSKRLDRAAELADRNPWAREILAFYSRILQFQKDLYERSHAMSGPPGTNRDGLRGSLNLDEAIRCFPDLIVVVRETGPPKLAEEAGRLRGSSATQIRGMLQRWLSATEATDAGGAFFPRVLLQPQAEQLARASGPAHGQVAGNKCPCCQSDPQLAVIRPEGDGGKRLLLCSFCQSEWEFRRILCPACGEEHHEKLPRYSAQGISAVRVEACEVCKSYLKSIDMTVDGLAVPVVDEVATAPLDLWAAEQGYHKIHLNLMGF
jgi:FdhE protein